MNKVKGIRVSPLKKKKPKEPTNFYQNSTWERTNETNNQKYQKWSLAARCLIINFY
jgi:hypothetical protein